ncbi:hypothetical protein BDZ97DRAFT_752807 [Flammula alnicola]|nr:hypothetical protein BDZ97DRAFT_752807 [Flammula alnicola]
MSSQPRFGGLGGQNHHPYAYPSASASGSQEGRQSLGGGDQGRRDSGGYDGSPFADTAGRDSQSLRIPSSIVTAANTNASTNVARQRYDSAGEIARHHSSSSGGGGGHPYPAAGLLARVQPLHFRYDTSTTSDSHPQLESAPDHGPAPSLERRSSVGTSTHNVPPLTLLVPGPPTSAPPFYSAPQPRQHQQQLHQQPPALAPPPLRPIRDPSHTRRMSAAEGESFRSTPLNPPPAIARRHSQPVSQPSAQAPSQPPSQPHPSLQRLLQPRSFWKPPQPQAPRPQGPSQPQPHIQGPPLPGPSQRQPPSDPHSQHPHPHPHPQQRPPLLTDASVIEHADAALRPTRDALESAWNLLAQNVRQVIQALHHDYARSLEAERQACTAQVAAAVGVNTQPLDVDEWDASKRQARAENEALRKESEALVAASKMLSMDHEALLKENEAVRRENDAAREENERLRRTVKELEAKVQLLSGTSSKGVDVEKDRLVALVSVMVQMLRDGQGKEAGVGVGGTGSNQEKEEKEKAEKEKEKARLENREEMMKHMSTMLGAVSQQVSKHMEDKMKAILAEMETQRALRVEAERREEEAVRMLEEVRSCVLDARIY